jgi:chorismate synthase
VAVKPIPSISLEQRTVDQAMQPVSLKIKGRHDISAIPRINPVCDAMVAIVLVDHLLKQKALDSFSHK